MWIHKNKNKWWNILWTNLLLRERTVDGKERRCLKLIIVLVSASLGLTTWLLDVFGDESRPVSGKKRTILCYSIETQGKDKQQKCCGIFTKMLSILVLQQGDMDNNSLKSAKIFMREYMLFKNRMKCCRVKTEFEKQSFKQEKVCLKAVDTIGNYSK